MNNLDSQYQSLLKDILSNGVHKKDRTGTGTISVFGRQIRHKMSEGFPLLTTKKMAWKSIVVELLWFLRGDTNIKYLVDNDCHIWDGDAYKNYESKITNSIIKATNEGILKSNCEDEGFSYLSRETFIGLIKSDPEFAKEWGELGPIYGKQWRRWQGWISIPEVHRLAKGSIWHDQIQRLLHLLETEPDSRRLMVSSWNVAEMDEMVLPPCHYSFQLYTRELDLDERRKLVSPEMHAQIYTGGDSSTLSHSEIDQWKIPRRAISLIWNQRSVDTFLGLPFNIASYGLLLHLISKKVNMIPDELIGNLGDTHLYANHIEAAEEQISRSSFDLPDLSFDFEYKYFDGYLVRWDAINPSQIKILNYESHPAIKAPLSN